MSKFSDFLDIYCEGINPADRYRYDTSYDRFNPNKPAWPINNKDYKKEDKKPSIKEPSREYGNNSKGYFHDPVKSFGKKSEEDKSSIKPSSRTPGSNSTGLFHDPVKSFGRKSNDSDKKDINESTFNFI